MRYRKIMTICNIVGFEMRLCLGSITTTLLWLFSDLISNLSTQWIY